MRIESYSDHEMVRLLIFNGKKSPNFNTKSEVLVFIIIIIIIMLCVFYNHSIV